MASNALFVLIMTFSLSEAVRTLPKLSALKGESKLSYELVHPLHKVVATTKNFLCEIELLEETQEIQSVEFRAEVTSFDSGNSNRDAHALEVVEALLYPEVVFQSERIENQQDKLRVSGKLTFHGVTQPINFTARKRIVGSKLVVEGETEISLTAFKVERPALFFVKVEDALKISFEIAFALT
ncbi:MAG: YceI family protein [Chloroherpetonaceae bacterium]|nr:YceI family protein [Chloroherpetonaceae bacterium]MCS7211323.1 YceI family protein [Chloroherpetonaceae bacterium]MDW8020280.1 YceI family protein [Chloroherpetonaceae bacterium]